MAITGSPDIFVSEQDLSTYVGSFDVTTAALVGDFEWGPVNQITRISNEARLKTYFGLPSDRNFKDWFTAKNYLEYSNSLALVRVCLNSARNSFIKPDEKKIPKYNTETKTYELDSTVKGNDREYYKYSPMGEEATSSDVNTVFSDTNNNVITNFPNYVAFLNDDNKYTVERASAKIEAKYGASPKFVLDLNAEKELDTILLKKEALKKGADSDELEEIVSKKKDETLSNMKLGAVFACVLVPKTSSVTKLDELIEEYDDAGLAFRFVYLRKQFLNKLYSFSADETSALGTVIDYTIPAESEYYSEDISSTLIADRIDKLFADTDSSTNASQAINLTNFHIVVLNTPIDLNVKNTTDSIMQESSIAKLGIPIYAKYPGVYGDRIRVSVINKPAYETYKRAVSGQEHLSSLSNLTKNSAVDIIGMKNLPDDAIVVVVSLKDIATGKDVLKEYGTFSLTKGSTDITGYDNYVFNFFGTQSNYVVFNKLAFEKLYGEDLKTAFINIDTRLQNGRDYDKENLGGSAVDYSNVTTTNSNGVDYEINTQLTPIVSVPTDITDRTPLINIIGGVGAYMQGWDLFRNEENDMTRVEILMQGGASPEVGQYIINLAEQRKDCVACVSPTVTECVNVTDPCDRIADGTGSFYSSSSYAFMDGNYKYQYDNYNDVYRWMPLNGDIAGLCAYVDANEEPWMSIGGRQIRNCIKLAFYPSKADRDVLFEHNVNPVTNFSNEGNVIWGDWTRVTNTAFNFFGVRRMFLYVEKNIKQFARKIMFNQNDQITRDAFVLAVTPFLDSVVGGRGIQEYGIFAGSDVTSPEEMDKGIFRAKFIIKPVRSIRYVDLVFVAVRSDMSVSEVVE